MRHLLWKKLFLLLLIFISACKSNTQKQTLRLGKDSTGIITVQSDDEEMNTAITFAKISLSKFDSALSSKNSNYHSFSLKVKFTYGDNNAEHIWFGDIVRYGEGYIGVVNNEPEYIPALKLYDTIKIHKGSISDWMYLDKKVLKGGFTIKLLRKRMTPDERVKFDSSALYEWED